MDTVILQRADHFETRAVADMSQPRIAVSAEVALQDAAIFGAVEKRAPGFQFAHALGASLACNSAMRELFRYWPPRMVSAKWTRQLSRSSTFPIAAATPPSAITVWAFREAICTRPDLYAGGRASIAARKPAPPAPITKTSCSKTWYSGHLEDSPICPDPHRAHAHVQIGESNREQADQANACDAAFRQLTQS